MNDKVRFGLMTFISSIFPVLELTGVVSFTGDQVAAIMAFIGNGLSLLMLFWKTGQGVDVAGTRAAAEGAAVAAAVAADTVIHPQPPEH